MSAEAHLSFSCFGGTVAVHVRGASEEQGQRLAGLARLRLLDAHRRLTRFDPESELSRFNRDRRTEVPASPLLRRLATAVVLAGERSGGLVDATLLDDIERAGYTESLGDRAGQEPPRAAAIEGERAAARPNPAAHWRRIEVDEQAAAIVRPTGVRIDAGGIAKGLLADLVGEGLRETGAYAVDCCGDIRLGGSGGQERAIAVDDPFGGEPLHRLALRTGAVATSGTSRRSWVGPDGRAAHQILDPRSGRPARTGLVQATAVAPTALLAEIYAKAALLSGPERAQEWLPHGGVLVAEDGGVEVLAPQRPLAEAVAA